MIKLCYKCNTEGEFGKNKSVSGINSACKKCQQEYRDSVKLRKLSGTYVPYGGRQSKESLAKKQREYRLRNKERLRVWHREYERKHSKTLYKKKISRLNKIREEGIKEYGGCCQCCGLDKIEFLTIDHINGRGEEKKCSGRKLWSKLKTAGWPKDNIQILCWNCNCAKGLWGTCPHQEGKNAV